RRLGQGCRSEYGIFAIGRAASFPWHVAVSLQKRTAVSERFRTPGVSPPIQHASREPAAAQSCRVIDEGRYGRLSFCSNCRRKTRMYSSECVPEAELDLP